ncbi:lactate 2-monooxygenase [Caulobacter vibrioides]|uniref:L-lactate 2-monooxygenase n=2 Tax=Caulobacter vibrioides TaxID=155892 RepID=Q9A8F8_CAUVC|nr:lactate 2-monooxygenase [Caulobacter vibrioides]YP_002516835.1 lactate 2-monooxygenase [Caulobacter vibrioides NA1000]AAK23377.1 L-lactate 2-monooxygenase [Caulobacter vibrioides CB15]ACL94927.1 lactate 2-monooxygenase [Caulobacter vibrioides NA1000]ATC28207.1 lactate 2-monooxygenase [Caulobacter vibrioides]QXZ53472.1 lactate 2-monooxygenase [Caulobacter vibrioides]
MAHYGDYQNEIYGAGLQGVRPKWPVDFKTLEARATAAMSPDLLSYVQGGCGDEFTQRRNADAFHDWGVVPRMMVDASKRDLSIELFGLKLPTPLFMSPIGVIGMCAQDGHGDIATAVAAQRTGVPVMASTLANDPIEKVGAALGDGVGFFQLYTPKDRDLAESLIRRAETAGFKALVVTLDTWVTGWRPRDLNDANFPQLRGHVLQNYFTDPRFLEILGKPVAEDPATAIRTWGGLFGKTLTWEDLAWLRSATKLPIVLKGICHPDDARRAVDLGVDGVFCSNHGGRQANGGIAAIDLLEDVVTASGNTPVLFDSGVRSGSDAAKALAMGARAVGIGRPYAYGLAIGGVDGVVHVLRSILAELDLLMAVDGFPTLAALRDAGVRPVRRAGV